MTPAGLLEPGSSREPMGWRVAIQRWLVGHGVIESVDESAKPWAIDGTRLPDPQADGDTCRLALVAWLHVEDDLEQSHGRQRRALEFVRGTLEKPGRHPDMALYRRLKLLKRRAELFGGGGAYETGLLNQRQLDKAYALAERMMELHKELFPIRGELVHFLDGALSEIATAGILRGKHDRTESVAIWYLRECFEMPLARIAALLGRLTADGRAVVPDHPRLEEICHTLAQATHQINKEIAEATQS